MDIFWLPIFLFSLMGCSDESSEGKSSTPQPVNASGNTDSPFVSKEKANEMIRSMGFESCSVIGNGGGGIAYQVSENCQDLTSKRVVAKCSFKSDHFDEYKKEMDIMQKMNGINSQRFPKVYRFETNRDLSCIVMDQYGIDLEKKRKASSTKFTPKTIASLGLYMLETMKLLHENGYVHMDPHPANWLVSGSGDLVLIDYGNANRAYETGRWKDIYHVMLGLRFFEIGDDAHMWPGELQAYRVPIALCKLGVSSEVCQLLRIAAVPDQGDIDKLNSELANELNSILGQGAYTGKIIW
jgi:serine/threonine protein kinase